MLLCGAATLNLMDAAALHKSGQRQASLRQLSEGAVSMGRGGEELQRKCGEVRLRPADTAGIAEATRVAYAGDFHGLVGITWPSSC